MDRSHVKRTWTDQNALPAPLASHDDPVRNQKTEFVRPFDFGQSETVIWWIEIDAWYQLGRNWIQSSVYIYTGCPRRNGQNFGRVFLMLNYTDITQNTYIQSWTVTEIMDIEKCGLLGCPRTVRRPWRHTHPLRMPGNETLLANIVMQWPWWDNRQLRPV